MFSKNEPLSPQDLDSNDPEKRCVAREVVVNFFKEAIEVSNSNLIRNANTLLLKGDTKLQMILIGSTKPSARTSLN